MKISEAESLVMDVLWHRNPLAAEEIIHKLAETTQWRNTTIKTLLGRLLAKGAIASQREGRRYLYRPILKREDYVFRASKGLLDRLFGGRIAPLVAQFSERQKLSRKDLDELKRLIKEIGRDS
jgi:BlaI family penicillinase repressor